MVVINDDEENDFISYGLAVSFLTLIREFLGPSPSAFSEKNPESSLVTSQLGIRK